MERLDLTGLASLSDEVLEGIVARNGDTLRALAVKDCKQLTNQVREEGREGGREGGDH
jgi:hypothetical protein